MAYATYTYAQFRQELANALNDPGKVRWTDGELKVHTLNALRFWNALTGDNKVWFALPVTPGTVWYDLQAITGPPVSPRLVTLQDTDLYSWLQYALVEGQSPANAGLSSGQYSTDQLVQSLQRSRDEWLSRTGCTSTVYPLAITPGAQDQTLRETVIDVRRGYWLPTKVAGNYPAGATPYPLQRSDEFATLAYARDLANTTGNPKVMSPGVEPVLTLTLTPAPGFAGKVELLTVESQAALSNPPPPATALALPADFAPALMWRTLADLLETNAEGRDMARATYCRQRYEQFIELQAAYPFLLSARVADIPAHVDAVENLDRYAPGWETSATQTLIVGYSGQNLVGYVTAAPAQIALYMVAPANLPALDADFVQLGREVIDALLAYAVHTALFKDGMYEVQQSMSGLRAIVGLAAKRNAKVRAMSTFRDLLYAKAGREDIVAPRETETDAEEAVT